MGFGLTLTLLPLIFACSGPPGVRLEEAYLATSGGASIDHSLFNQVLGDYVDSEGRVDYAGLHQDTAVLDRYLAAIAAAPFAELSRDEKLALLINAYNAFTLRLILDHYPVESIRDIPEGERWDGRTWQVGGRRLTLGQIEHEELRAQFAEPRIHFAINCASVGCPPLANRAFVAAGIGEQLEAHAQTMHQGERWVRWDGEAGVLHLTKIYDWYGDDFRQAAESVVHYVARYRPEVAAALAAGKTPKVEWLDYDWSLNESPVQSAALGERWWIPGLHDRLPR